MKKQENGITLIALVITIIVMLILTGVTISLLLDDDGIINKAKQAVAKQEQAKIEEKLELLNASFKMDELMSSTGNVSGDNGFKVTDENPDGGVYKYLISNGITVSEEVVTVDEENGNKYIDMESCIVDAYILDEEKGIARYVLALPCEEKNGSEYKIKLELNVWEVEVNEEYTTHMSIVSLEKYSELENYIDKNINSEITENTEKYTYNVPEGGNTGDDVVFPILNDIYNILTENDIKIDESLLNADKDAFELEILQTKMSIDDYSLSKGWVISGFDIPCEKDGEKITIRAQIYTHESDKTGHLLPFKIK